MSGLTFEHLPEQATFIDESVLTIERTATIGIGRRWFMPVGVYRAADGFDALTKDQRTHHTLAISLSDQCDIERIDGALAGVRVLSKDDLSLQHVGETHHYRSLSSAEFAHIYFKPALLGSVLERGGRPPALRQDRTVFADAVLERESRAYVHRALDDADPPTCLEMNTRATVIAGLLAARHSVGGLAPNGVRGGLAPWQLKRACEAMEAHLDEDIGLDMLAGIAGCSPTHFSRAFKQSTGMPPFQWLLERRIKRAKALLDDPRVPLAEVALAVGFAAQPQFTTAFRRVTGVTPGGWRRERLA